VLLTVASALLLEGRAPSRPAWQLRRAVCPAMGLHAAPHARAGFVIIKATIA